MSESFLQNKQHLFNTLSLSSDWKEDINEVNKKTNSGTDLAGVFNRDEK